MKESKKLFRTATAVAALYLMCTPAVHAEKSSYSRAEQNLPSGTILSKSNIKEIFTETERPKGAISGSSILYGCKLYAPIKKNEPITDAEVCAGRWDSSTDVKPSDSSWVNAQKAAEAALKNDDLETAGRECEKAIGELEELAKKGAKITDFTEMTHLLIPYTEVELATWRAERHKHGNLEQRAQSLVERSQKELSLSQRLLAAMKQLLPADNFYVATQIKDVQHKVEDLQTAENLSSMANSMSNTNVSTKSDEK